MCAARVLLWFCSRFYGSAVHIQAPFPSYSQRAQRHLLSKPVPKHRTGCTLLHSHLKRHVRKERQLIDPLMAEEIEVKEVLAIVDIDCTRFRRKTCEIEAEGPFDTHIETVIDR